MPTKPEERVSDMVIAKIDREAAANRPVSKAIDEWGNTVSLLYYQRLGALEQASSAAWNEATFCDFTACGLMPGTISAALQV